MTSNNTIISIEHISKSFDGKTVLEDINLNIREGEFVTFLGPSGCGKTTLLRMLAGFLKPDSGRILMEGKDITDTPPHLRKLNTVFQRYALFPHLDVYDNVAFGLKLKKIPNDEIDRRVRKALRMVTMSDYEDRDVDSLSGGQQQRVAIARAIINRPSILLLDEPLSALDLKMRKDMQMELKEMHKQLGICFIYVTHDQEEALTLSDTVVVMNEGRIQQIGTPKDIYNEPQNCFVADFIGESNILNGVMIKDRLVRFLDHDFECVDEGFGENTQVDVVIRPEDIYIGKSGMEHEQFRGKVTSCIFKGIHYEMTVVTDEGYEILVQDYDAYEDEVGMYIKPYDIQVMHKECVRNSFEGEMTSPSTVRMLGTEFDCEGAAQDLKEGDKVRVEVEFPAVELMDSQDDGTSWGQVDTILYNGKHYHLTVKTDDGEKVFVDTDDVWDKGDLVGINIAAKDMKITKL